MDNIFFLSGLPRSGSTLLGSILSQNPDIYVTPTSPLLDLFCLIDENINVLKETYNFNYQEVSKNVFKGLAKNFYQDIDKKYVIDKHRGHPKNFSSLKKFVAENPKIICLVRPISEIICSYIKLINNSTKENFVDEHLQRINLRICTENRAKILWENYISDPYNSTKIGLDNYRNNILLIKYDDLIFNCDKTILDIYNFLGIDHFENHNFKNIENYCTEKDEKWGIENLHVVRQELKKTSDDPESILGAFLTKSFNQFNLT